jgi:hypothetical protein
MSNSSTRWAVRALIAGLLLISTALLGAGVSAADSPGPGAPGQNGTSWIGGGALHVTS